MGNLKNVMTKSGEFKVIDENKEPNWKFEYLHRSGNPFVSEEEIKKFEKKQEKKVEEKKEKPKKKTTTKTKSKKKTNE